MENTPDSLKNPEYQPPDSELAFYTNILQEAATLKNPPTPKPGPLGDQFNEVAKACLNELANLGFPGRTDLLTPLNYRTPEARQTYEIMGGVKYDALRRVIERRSNRREKIGALYAEQNENIPIGLLDTPPSAYQGDGLGTQHLANMRGCVLACYRMTAGHLLGEVPHEAAAGLPLLEQTSEITADALELYKTLQTPTFRQRSGQCIRILPRYGATFDSIKETAEKIKERLPQASILCNASIRSAKAARAIHSVMLLNTTRDTVQVIDPIEYQTNMIQRASFIQRWAQEDNKVNLIVSLPLHKEG